MGDRMLAAPLGDHRHLLAIGARPAERGIDGAVRRHRASGRDREIAAVDAVRGELLREAFMRLVVLRSEEHTSELQSLMRISYAVFCLKKKNTTYSIHNLPSQTYSLVYNAT